MVFLAETITDTLTIRTFHSIKLSSFSDKKEIIVAQEASDRLVVSVLEKAVELMQGGWSREYTALTRRGNICMYTSPQAKRFSLAGALWRAEEELGVSLNKRGDVTRFLNSHIGSVSAFNQMAESATDVIARLTVIIKDAKRRVKKEPDQGT